MAKDGKSMGTPRLRFPEFRKTPQWNLRPLSDVAENLDNKRVPITENERTKGNVPYYGASGIVDYVQDAIFDEDLLCVSEDGANLVARTYPIAFPISGRTWVNNHAHVLRFDDLATQKFIEDYLNSIDLRDFITGMAQPKLNRGMLDTIPIPLPEIKEQQKIAECLTSLDEVIAAQGQKVETLKAHKKGLMQQLFPREGETVPLLRFPEFCDAPEWEETSLGQVVDFQSGGTPSKANSTFWNGSIPWVSAKDMKQLFLEDSEDHITTAAVDDGAKLVPAGTLLMLVRGMTLLKDVPMCVLRCDMSFNQDVKALRPKENLAGLFLAFLLLGNKRRLLKMVDVAGHGTGKLNTDELKALELVVPPTQKEQQRIVDCLLFLDDQISAETEKLDALKTHKKALMQQLFPSAEGE